MVSHLATGVSFEYAYLGYHVLGKCIKMFRKRGCPASLYISRFYFRRILLIFDHGLSSCFRSRVGILKVLAMVSHLEILSNL